MGYWAWRLLRDQLSLFVVENILIRVDYLAADVIPALMNQARFNTTSELV